MKKVLHEVVEKEKEILSSIDANDHSLLIYSTSGKIYKTTFTNLLNIDSFSDENVRKYEGCSNEYDLKIASFSKNSNFIMAGCDDGNAVCILFLKKINLEVYLE